ncbi:MAG: hypothetical protein N2Z74_00580, partial [Syntrophales bacterium]|nr:hypothetical protein [Syntrophales bacterium]
MGKLGKREIIILSILLLVVLYAAYDFLVPKKRGATSTVTTAQRTAELNAFVNDLTARVSAGNIKNAPYLIFSRAEKEWKQDPFLD